MLQIPLQLQNDLREKLFKVVCELSKQGLYTSARLRNYNSRYLYVLNEEAVSIISQFIGIKISTEKHFINNQTDHITRLLRNLKHEFLFCEPVDILYYIQDTTIYIDNNIPNNILKMLLKQNKSSSKTFIYKDNLKQYLLKETLPFYLSVETLKSEFNDFIKYRDILL